MLCRYKVIPLKVWVLCQCGRTDLCAAELICLVPYRSIFLYEIGGILWLTLWRCWLHSCRMFILLAEYGLVHRGDCINCETFRSFVRSFVRSFCFCLMSSDAKSILGTIYKVSLFWIYHWDISVLIRLCLACKPFPGLCACTRIGRRCASVVAIRSLLTEQAGAAKSTA